MDDAACLDHTLDLVAQRVGDPAPLVFARLFAEAPELQAMFCNDKYLVTYSSGYVHHTYTHINSFFLSL